MATRTLQIVLAGDPASASRSFKKVGDDAERMGKRVDREGKRVHGFATVSSKGFARVGAASTAMQTVAGGAVALLAKSFVTSASDINESLTKNQVLFGRFATDLDRFSQTSAKSFGISRAAALEYTGVFGNLFRATGVARGESAKFSVQLTKLAADMASFNNTSIEDALEAIRSGIVGETEPLRRFGVNLNDAQLRTEALRQGLIRTTKEALNPQQKALAAQALIVRQTSAAHGDFARTSGGLANQTRILKARLADAGAEIGTRLLPFALRAATALNRLITETQQGRGPLAAMARAVRTVVAAISDVVGWFRRHKTATTVLMSAVAGLTAAFVAYRIGVIAATAATRAMTVAQAALDVVMRANPIALAITAVIALGVALVTAYKRSETFRRVVNTAWRTAKSGAESMAGAIKSVVIPVFNTLKSAADKVARGVGAISRAFGAVKGAIGSASDWANPFGDGIGKIPLPSGGSGAGLMGADFDLAPFARIGAGMGLRVSSGLRPGSVTSSGNTSYHSSGDAIDMAGPPSAMGRFFQTMRGMFGSKLRELIYTPGGTGIKDGRSYTYSGQVAADHYDHVHVAYTGPFGDGLGRFSSTAYGPPWGGIQGTGVTATGVNLKGSPHRYGVAVDPSVIPLGTRLKIKPNPFNYGGYFTAFDTGGAIKGNRIDFYDWRGRASQMQWGSRAVTVWTEDEAPTAAERRSGHAAPKSRPMSPREAFRQSQENASLQHDVVLRTARRAAGGKYVMGPRGIPVLRGSGSGPSKTGEISDLSGETPATTDFLDRDLAMAELSGDPDQIRKAQEAVRDYWQGKLTTAQGTADPRDDIDAARNLKSALDALKSTIEDEKKARDEHTAALKTVGDEMKRQTDLAQQYASTSEFQKTKYLADIFSGQFGRGIIGRGFTAGVGTEVAY